MLEVQHLLVGDNHQITIIASSLTRKHVGLITTVTYNFVTITNNLIFSVKMKFLKKLKTQNNFLLNFILKALFYLNNIVIETAK